MAKDDLFRRNKKRHRVGRVLQRTRRLRGHLATPNKPHHSMTINGTNDLSIRKSHRLPQRNRRIRAILDNIRMSRRGIQLLPNNTRGRNRPILNPKRLSKRPTLKLNNLSTNTRRLPNRRSYTTRRQRRRRGYHPRDHPRKPPAILIRPIFLHSILRRNKPKYTFLCEGHYPNVGAPPIPCDETRKTFICIKRLNINRHNNQQYNVKTNKTSTAI